ncbi:right-handed parallel beta-helix repeat-containing protein [Bacillus solimangrovi]|uniref:Carbohydrate-binding/sugar hydrolysis domain-containing protein n=1 Tax=Bacillus solimangrovi TaxID=1305675 RepID=A0A1E5LD76_9BACI|nr:right-handed parallel beta-helix repeat-containing protein [Bacillus solimangrovi]OEH92047.1 hypothetical protein BFG57_17155 [Bacillus solimangrovi]
MQVSTNKIWLILILSASIISFVLLIGILFFQQKVLIVGEGSQFSTIQSAVTVADSGDIILVTDSLSPYEEAVEIENKTEITIIGVGKPVLDGSNLPLGSNGITLINSSKIKVSGLTIQQYMGFNGSGISVESSSDNNMFVRNRLIDNEGDGFLSLESTRNTLFNNETNMNNGFGVFIDASQQDLLVGNVSNDNLIDGILIASPNSWIIGNQTFRNDFGIDAEEKQIFIGNVLNDNVGSDTFDVDGSQNILIGNKLKNNKDDAIKIEEDFNIVIGNVAIGNVETGLILDNGAANNIVIGNRLLNNIEDGILVDDDATDNLVMRNKIVGNIRDGIRVGDETENNTFKRNIVNENGRGIFIRNNNSAFTQRNTVIENNIIRNVGEGVKLEGGVGNTVKNNKINKNGVGISLTPRVDEDTMIKTLAQQNQIVGNTIRNNITNGINFDESIDNTVQKNTIISNRANGILLDVNSTSNRVLSNTALLNGLFDIRDDENNFFQGNICETSSGTEVDCGN